MSEDIEECNIGDEEGGDYERMCTRRRGKGRSKRITVPAKHVVARAAACSCLQAEQGLVGLWQVDRHLQRGSAMIEVLL